jgi:hypothetical protein
LISQSRGLGDVYKRQSLPISLLHIASKNAVVMPESFLM